MFATRTLRAAAGLFATAALVAACDPPPGSPAPAALSATPGTLELSTTSGGADDVGTVTIRNTGGTATDPLVRSNPTLFSVTGDTCTGQVLDPLEACEIEVTYAAAPGTQNVQQSLLVWDSGSVAFVNVRLHGATSAP